MSYLTQHFKGKYRIVPELSPESHDVPREEDGTVDKSYDDLYIKCQFGNKIYYYGRGTFIAYIPSIIRGKNILKKLDELVKQKNELTELNIILDSSNKKFRVV